MIGDTSMIESVKKTIKSIYTRFDNVIILIIIFLVYFFIKKDWIGMGICVMFIKILFFTKWYQHYKGRKRKEEEDIIRKSL